MKKILITGASGFIGSFLVEKALQQGMETWAAIRKSSSRAYLKDPRIHFIELDLGNPEKLKAQLHGHHFDYVIHAAGATKCLHRNDFFRVNTLGTQHLVEALRQQEKPIERFVFISSLSVFGAIKEQRPYADICDDDIPQPSTAYGQSKLECEQMLDRQEGFPYIILRPTGVYGPREKDYFMMAKSIKGHVDFAVGYQPQDITFIYVEDLVQAAFLALDRGTIGAHYALSDGQTYNSRTFSDLIRHELGNPWLLRITAPIWLLFIIAHLSNIWAHISGKPTTINPDKYHIMKQRNWRCDNTKEKKELGYKPLYPLNRGVRCTMNWYKDNGWI